MKKSVICLLLALFSTLVNAQGFRTYEGLLQEESLRNTVSFLADDYNTGRASGTAGANRCAQMIMSRFRQLGLKPVNWTYTQSFKYRDSVIVRNVAGLITARIPTDEYIIITAH